MSSEKTLTRYSLDFEVRNAGSVTLEKWSLQLDVPTELLKDTRNASISIMEMASGFGHIVSHRRVDGSPVRRITIDDPFRDGKRFILHPGQTLRRNEIPGVPDFILEVGHSSLIATSGGVVSWTMYLNNSPPVSGSAPMPVS